MQRDYQLKTWAGMFQVGAGGHAIKSELPVECATRELREDAGILRIELKELYNFKFYAMARITLIPIFPEQWHSKNAAVFCQKAKSDAKRTRQPVIEKLSVKAYRKPAEQKDKAHGAQPDGGRFAHKYKTCPVESIYQIGTVKASAPWKLLAEITV